MNLSQKLLVMGLVSVCFAQTVEAKKKPLNSTQMANKAKRVAAATAWRANNVSTLKGYVNAVENTSKTADKCEKIYVAFAFIKSRPGKAAFWIEGPKLFKRLKDEYKSVKGQCKSAIAIDDLNARVAELELKLAQEQQKDDTEECSGNDGC